jgi:hypothetical protein
MPYFAVLYTYADAPADLDAHRPAHRAFLRTLLDAGTMLAAGAYTDEPAGALLLFQADSADEVDTILAGDPFRAQGLVTGQVIRGWSAAIGPWAA